MSNDVIAVRDQNEIYRLRYEFRQLSQRLALTVSTACPGPHEFVQHRDHKPPWCKTCRYTGTGERIELKG